MKLYLCVFKDGSERGTSVRPIRWNNGISWVWSTKGKGDSVDLKLGTVKALVGKGLRWEDDPVEIEIRKRELEPYIFQK